MTTDRRSKTIAGRNRPSENTDERYVLASGATVTPGMLLEVAGETAEGTMEVQPHSTAAGPVDRVIVAVNRSHPPRGNQTRTLRKNQDYTDAGELVETLVFREGDSTDNALLADGESVAPGDPLVSDGGGGLQAATGDGTDETGFVAEADETVDNTSGEYARIEVTF